MAPASVAGELLDAVVPVSDLLAKVSEKDLTRAWLAGEVEFGRREHVLTGKPGNKSETVGSVLIIETGTNWSGPKTTRHKPLKDLLAEPAPRAQEYRAYVADGDAGGFKLVTATEAEAQKALALVARLTDKGLAALQA